MTKVLIASDNPICPTGMGKVHREVGRQLLKHGYQVYSLGFFTSPFLEKWKEWPVYQTNNNYYGSDVFDNTIAQVWPDVVITIGDIWMINYIADINTCKSRPFFKWIGYIPIDGESYGGGIPVSWKPIIKDMDTVVAYTDYGKNAISKTIPEILYRIEKIPHGVDLNIYKPCEQERRLQIRRELGIADDVIIFLMVARNQFRKNIPEFCKGWRKFIDSGKKRTLFWPHMSFRDPMGWNLNEIFNIYKMNKEIMYLSDVAQTASNLDLISENRLAQIYNLADVVIMMGGEGFGLPTLEAMACGKPILAINHSANIEIVKGRGELVDVQNYISGAHSTERPIPNIDDLAEKLNLLYTNPMLREEHGKKSLEFAQTLSWNKIGNDWKVLLDKVVNPFSYQLTPERICG